MGLLWKVRNTLKSMEAWKGEVPGLDINSEWKEFGLNGRECERKKLTLTCQTQTLESLGCQPRLFHLSPSDEWTESKEKNTVDRTFPEQAERELEKEQANGGGHVGGTGWSKHQNYSLIKVSVLFPQLLPPLPFPSPIKVLGVIHINHCYFCDAHFFLNTSKSDVVPIMPLKWLRPPSVMSWLSKAVAVLIPLHLAVALCTRLACLAHTSSSISRCMYPTISSTFPLRFQ